MIARAVSPPLSPSGFVLPSLSLSLSTVGVRVLVSGLSVLSMLTLKCERAPRVSKSAQGFQ